MHAIQQVLHRSARPISVHEFRDAILATCKPRFPEARGSMHRPVGLAISGGVDSMALAYLCSQIRKLDPDIMITDHPCAGFRAFVVDHRLREGSTEEAHSVMKALHEMGIPSDLLPINWKKELGENVDVKNLSNIESAARRARYRKLGHFVAFRKMATLLLAHHQDDQYETVLMRLINGHRNRALIGMREASDIPECEGLFGVYGSGWVDDQTRKHPFYNTKLSKKERKSLKQELKFRINELMHEDQQAEDQLANLGVFDTTGADDSLGKTPIRFNWSPQLGSMPIENGGVSIHRPFLEFGKDRLVATCVENNVPWFEDHTNTDPTLTTRNAIRHMYKSCELPRALQKPAVLALSKSCQHRARAQDAEARRLLQRTVLHDFEPHVGTMVVQFPNLQVHGSKGASSSNEYHQHRLSQKRIIAALALQRVIALVSPEYQAPSVTNLQNVVSRLFPSLESLPDASRAAPPKAFNVAGLHFMPIESSPPSVASSALLHPQIWYVSRHPYVATEPLPQWRISAWSPGLERRRRPRKPRSRWSVWLPWHFWDGRFWIRLTHRLPSRLVVMPFLVEHSKDFRTALPPQDRARLAAVLKQYAPGKTRYTLPAIYAEEPVDFDNVVSHPKHPEPRNDLAINASQRIIGKPILPPIDRSKMRLLALPTLDFQLPGLEKLLQHEVRFKKADRDTLRTMGSFDGGSFAPLRASSITHRSRNIRKLCINSKRRERLLHKRQGHLGEGHQAAGG
ncbi:hypothetical protein JX265_010700 [Neoarthrinium moseri]|uniref:tRNA(Ile)-lysidine synthetase n=1 Tax=Neoarthrinium moseri TaxID=1658444 RepID=A0A9P9WDR0_9PEZI|nr:hypothetical protein JX265_010700 [Neoarthrinium moseri]